MTPPARKAVLKLAVQPSEPGRVALMVVRALEKTATFMPKYPLTQDVTEPTTNAIEVRHGVLDGTVLYRVVPNFLVRSRGDTASSGRC